MFGTTTTCWIRTRCANDRVYAVDLCSRCGEYMQIGRVSSICLSSARSWLRDFTSTVVVFAASPGKINGNRLPEMVGVIAERVGRVSPQPQPTRAPRAHMSGDPRAHNLPLHVF